MCYSMSNQRKIKPTPLDFDDTRNIVWVYGENNPHKILASYVTWLPSYNDFVFVDMGLLKRPYPEFQRDSEYVNGIILNLN